MPLVHDDLAFSFLQNFFDTYDSDFAKKKLCMLRRKYGVA